MSAISLKSITGITSITTPAGVDNQLTLHTNNTTERLRISANGDVTTTGASYTRANAGFTARKGDSVNITRASGTPLEINRTGNDGTVINFFQNQNIIGSVGVDGSDMWFGANGSAYDESVRIDSSGRLLVGTNTNNAHANADNVVISGTGNIGLSIMSTDSGRSSIYFGDSSSSPGSYAGFIDFMHSSNSFNIGRGNDNSLTIDSSGRLHIGSSNNTGSNTKLVVGAGNNVNTTCLINTGDVDTNALTLSNWDGSTTTNKTMMHFDCSGIAGFNVGIPAATAAFEVRNTSGGGGFVHITSAGLVGIGSEIPSGKLEVADATQADLLLLKRTTGNSGTLSVHIGGADPGAVFTTSGISDDFVFRPGGNERLRITSSGDIEFGVQSGDTPITNAHIRHIDGGQDYWNSTKGDYRSLRYLTFFNGIDNAYGMGISASELELQSQQDIGFYTGTSGSGTGRRNLRILLDNSANSLDFESNTNLYLKGTANAPQRHAKINIGRNSAGEDRAIDIWGSWAAGESKSITFNHGTTATQMVGQINCIYHSPGSSMRWGKLYHNGDSSTYTMTLDSTSTTGADLTLTNGNLKLASGHGINFSATSDASGMQNELLDDYEEGTWTPAPTAGSFTSATGRYTKVGRIVVATFAVQVNTDHGANFFQFNGLPFDNVASNAGENLCSIGFTDSGLNGNIVGAVYTGTALIFSNFSGTNYRYNTSGVSGKIFRGGVTYMSSV